MSDLFALSQEYDRLRARNAKLEAVVTAARGWVLAWETSKQTSDAAFELVAALAALDTP